MGGAPNHENRILVMCDYHGSPLWTADGSASLDVESFALSDATKRALRAWAARHDQLGNDRWSAEDEQAFDEEGERLCGLVTQELGATYEVGFFSERSGRARWTAEA